MAQDDEDSGYERGDVDLMLPDLPEPERPKAECKKSLFKRSSQETPPYAASTQQPPKTPRPLISPMTLGVVVREGMVGSLPPPAKKQRKRLPRKGPKGAKAASSSQPRLKPWMVDKIPCRITGCGKTLKVRTLGCTRRSPPYRSTS